MDGVLVDGEPLHFRAVNELLGEDGLAISLEQYKPYMGTKAGWTEIIRDFNLPRTREYYAPRYHELILRQYGECSVPLPGAVELVRSLRERSVPVAVASSSIEPWVTSCLERLGLGAAFDRIVTGSDVTEGKPSPEIYLLAARHLGVESHACLAIEDAPAGILSAKAAGMTCWAVRTPYTRDLELPGPDRVLESLEEIHAQDLLGVAA